MYALNQKPPLLGDSPMGEGDHEVVEGAKAEADRPPLQTVIKGDRPFAAGDHVYYW